MRGMTHPYEGECPNGGSAGPWLPVIATIDTPTDWTGRYGRSKRRHRKLYHIDMQEEEDANERSSRWSWQGNGRSDRREGEDVEGDTKDWGVDK